MTPGLLSRPSRALDLLVAVYLAVVVCSILYPVSFFSLPNLQAVLNNLAFIGLLAVGMMLLMVAGVFDLSVGALSALTGVVAGWLMTRLGWPVPAACAAALILAAAAGGLNGLLVTKARVNALIATLGMMGVYKGVAVLVGGPGVANLPAGFTALGQTAVGGIQPPVWLLLAFALAAHVLLAHTRFFRQYYYVGSNPRAARLSGLPVERLQVVAFTLMGLTAGLAGLANAARFGAALSTSGDGAELQAITAVILGGASLAGGRGTVAGALAGVLFIALVTNVLNVAAVSSYWHGIVVGVVLVLAVGLDGWKHRGAQA